MPAAIEQITKDLATKLESTSRLVDAEAAAGRLSEPAAQTLRWTLQTALSASGRLQLRTLIASSRLPTDNAKVMTALAELETANTEAQTLRARMTTDATREIQTRLATLLKGATKAEECDAFERAVAAVRPAFQNDSGYVPQSATFSAATNVAQTLRRLLAAEASGDLEAISGAVQNLRATSSYSGSSALAVSAEIEDRVQRATKPRMEAIASAQADFYATVAANKPLAEIEAALRRYSEASRGHIAFRDHVSSTNDDPRANMVAYEYVVAALKGAETGENPEMLRATIQQGRQYLSSIRHEGIEKVRAVLDGLEAKIEQRAQKKTEARLTDVQRRIAAVTKPAELDALAAEIAAWSREPQTPRQSSGADVWGALATELSGLAAMWVSPSGGVEDRLRENPQRHPALVAPLRELHRRIERETVSRQLRAPELKSAPFDAMETEQAIEALADQLATKGDWRRLLEFAEARTHLLGGRGRSPQDDSIAALRSFFAAQNLELAEQWSEAARAYREVLRSASARAPIQPAAEKLKALLKAHPEPAPGATLPTPAR